MSRGSRGNSTAEAAAEPPSDVGRACRRQRRLGATAIVCVVSGLGALLYCAWVVIGAALYQRDSRNTLQQLRERSLSSMASASHGARVQSLLVSAPAEGSPLADLQIPRIGLSVMVLEGTGARTLRLGAGHESRTALPGADGNVVLAAHRDTFFRSLRDIRVGDLVKLDSPGGTFNYQVIWTRVVPPEDTASLQPSRSPILTLVTCYPFYYIGPAPERFVVRARRLN